METPNQAGRMFTLLPVEKRVRISSMWLLTPIFRLTQDDIPTQKGTLANTMLPRYKQVQANRTTTSNERLTAIVSLQHLHSNKHRLQHQISATSQSEALDGRVMAS